MGVVKEVAVTRGVHNVDLVPVVLAGEEMGV
jgi:hypothetical protein